MSSGAIEIVMGKERRRRWTGEVADCRFVRYAEKEESNANKKGCTQNTQMVRCVARRL